VAIQTAAHGILINIGSSYAFAATGADILSTFVVCPSECIMIQQQKTGRTFWKTLRHIYST